MTDTHLSAKYVSSVAENKQNDENMEPLMEEFLLGNDEQLKITDVNQFCLEHVFMYLDLADLLNVAHANKYLRLATISPFAQKYGQKQFQLQQITYYCRNSNEIITIEDLRTIFQMLRCFGQSIKQLRIFYQGPNYKNYHRIMDYVNEFCVESLANIEFDPAWGLEHMKKPFANVEEITISQMYLQKKCLSRIFPKLRRLILRDHYSPIVIDYFPNLQYFSIDLTIGNGYVYAGIDALKLNPHIKSLRIRIPSFSFLQNICDHLQSVKNLDICIMVVPKKQSQQLKSNLIHFQNVKKFSIYIDKIARGSIAFPKLPFLFGQLKEFVLDGYAICNDFYNDFLSENPTIEKLTLDYARLNSVTSPSKLQKILPYLKEINLLNNYYHIDYILQHWTNDLKTVKRFSFINSGATEGMKKMPANKWHIIVSRQSICTKVVTLERSEDVTHSTPFSLDFSSWFGLYPRFKKNVNLFFATVKKPSNQIDVSVSINSIYLYHFR